jgi:hypothetical protein
VPLYGQNIVRRPQHQTLRTTTARTHSSQQLSLLYLNSITPDLTMSDVAKPDPAADQAANPSATLVKDETAKVTTDIAANKESTTAISSDNKPLTEKATEAATSAAAAVKDNVFSMFGGGPAKVKKEEAADDIDEPSGATKKTDEVRWPMYTFGALC